MEETVFCYGEGGESGGGRAGAEGEDASPHGTKPLYDKQYALNFFRLRLPSDKVQRERQIAKSNESAESEKHYSTVIGVCDGVGGERGGRRAGAERENAPLDWYELPQHILNIAVWCR